MTVPQHDYQPGDRRTELGRARQRARSRRLRKGILSASAAAVLLVAVALGAWYGYRRLKGESEPPPKTYMVTIPEGLTLTQTSRKVDEATGGSISESEYLAAAGEGGYEYGFLEGSNGTLEGFLFPKTYEVTSATSARWLVDRQLKQFGLETEQLEWSRSSSLGVTPYQVVIIASLIEEEAKVPEDRPLIASVIYNRLKRNMKLGIDAAVLYALGEHKEVLTNEDLEVDSPYNTYRIQGLPPGPICSPGFESLRAALHPAQTDYIYYILTGADGRHSFTADYQQFSRWKEERERRQPPQ